MLKTVPFFQRETPNDEPEEPISKAQPKIKQSGWQETDEVLLIWGSLSTKTRIDLGNELNILDLSVLYKNEKVRNYLRENYPLTKTKPILKRRTV